MSAKLCKQQFDGPGPLIPLTPLGSAGYSVDDDCVLDVRGGLYDLPWLRSRGIPTARYQPYHLP